MTTATRNPTLIARGRTYTFRRVFDAPRERVFKAWIDPKQVAQWWGPRGFTNPVCLLDARVGGEIRIDMHGPDGRVFPMGGEFQEIAQPDRLVFSSCALDERGEALLEVRNHVAFDEQEGKTLLDLQARVVRSTGIGDQYLEGMAEGWTQSLDRLADFLEKTSKGD